MNRFPGQNCRHAPLLPTLVAASVASLITSGSFGQCRTDTLTAGSPQAEAQFGSATAIHADRIAIGAPYEDVGAGQNHGAVEMFRRVAGGWIPDGRITAPAPAPYARFGTSVDVDGDAVLIGEPGANTGGAQRVGRALLYVRNGSAWQLGRIFEPFLLGWPDLDASYFGKAVALDGDFALIGMPDAPSGTGNKPGKAFLYQRTADGTAWELKDTFDSPVNDDSMDFGDVLAMQHGNTTGDTFAIIGNPHATTAPLSECGQVRSYKRPVSGTDWGTGEIVAPGDQQAGANFGSAVAVSGGTLVVGAMNYDRDGLADVGAAYVFTRSALQQWVQVCRLDSPYQVAGAHFGSTVTIDGDRLTVSSDGRVHTYRFINGLWEYEWTLRDQTTDFGERAVGLSGDSLVIGSRTLGISGMILAGKAFTYELNDANAVNTCALANWIPTGTVWGCTTGATRDGRSQCDSQASGGTDVWYRWVAPCHGTAHIDTELSDFDTLLSVHTDCPTAAATNQVACSQPSASNYAYVAFEVEEGESFLIRIAGAAVGISGNYILNIDIDCASTCPPDIAPQGGDGIVDIDDLLMVISAWGGSGDADINGDAVVNIDDLLAVISAWGACPQS